MPTAPSLQRTVVDAPAPNVRVSATPSPDALGGQIGETAANAGVRFYDLITRSANQTAVFEADRKMAELQTNLEQQMLSRKGKAALGADAEALTAFDAEAERIQAALANDRQRGGFRGTALQRRQQLNEQAQKHIRTEYGAFQDAETIGTFNSAKDRTRRNPDSPTIIRAERQRAVSALAAWAQRKGLIGEITEEMVNDPAFQREYAAKGQPPPTWAEVQAPGASRSYQSQAYQDKRQILESSLHKEVVEGLLAQDHDQEAKAYAEANRMNFTAADLDAVEKGVESGSTRGESKRQTAEIIAATGLDTPDQRRAARERAKAIKHDTVSDATVQRLEHEIQVYDKLKDQDYSRRFELGAKILEDQGRKRPTAMLEDLLPVPFLNAMAAKDRDALRLHLDRIRKPVDHPHDPKTWFGFQSLTDTQLATVTPPEMMRTYLNQFDGTHYDRALAEWNAARNRHEKGDARDTYVSALSDKELIKNTAETSGLFKNPKKLTEDEYVWHQRFETEAALALSKLSKKDATTADKQTMLDALSDRLLKQKYRAPGVFGFVFGGKEVPGVVAQALEDTTGLRTPLADITPARQAQLKAALKASGHPVTNANIEELEAQSRVRKLQGGR